MNDVVEEGSRLLRGGVDWNHFWRVVFWIVCSSPPSRRRGLKSILIHLSALLIVSPPSRRRGLKSFTPLVSQSFSCRLFAEITITIPYKITNILMKNSTNILWWQCYLTALPLYISFKHVVLTQKEHKNNTSDISSVLKFKFIIFLSSVVFLPYL